MFCQYCGARAPEDALFCPYCGASLPQASACQPIDLNKEPNPNPSAASQNPYKTPQEQPIYFNVPDYLIWNIFTILCCCLPAGVVGLIYSLLTISAKSRCDWARAMTYSRAALVCFWISLIGGIAVYVLFAVSLVVESTFGSFLPL